ncbi:hypothetical protein STEG23_032407 [Scotinomys teguina]
MKTQGPWRNERGDSECKWKIPAQHQEETPSYSSLDGLETEEVFYSKCVPKLEYSYVNKIQFTEELSRTTQNFLLSLLEAGCSPKAAQLLATQRVLGGSSTAMATSGGVASKEGPRYAEYLPPSTQRPDADVDHAAVSLRAAAVRRSSPRATHPWTPRSPTSSSQAASAE